MGNKEGNICTMSAMQTVGRMPLKISVVVATYNRAGLLNRLLKDLAAQSLSPDLFEVVVVDDGSRTPVQKQIDGQDWPYKLTLIRQQNSGAAIARHNGIVQSCGEFVVIVDDDMALGTDFLEKHLAAYSQTTPPDVVLGRIVQSEKLSDMPLHSRLQQHHLQQMFDKWEPGCNISGASLYTGNVSFRRTLYDKVGGFNLTLRQAEDRELGVRFEEAGAMIVIAPEAVTLNGSDHIDREAWMETSRRYGVLDWRIANDHKGVIGVDPFHFLFLVNPVSRPILTTVLAFPHIASPLSRLVLKVSDTVDRFHLDQAALAGTTLAYGIQYFRGVRDEAGSAKKLWGRWRQYLKKREKQKLS